MNHKREDETATPTDDLVRDLARELYDRFVAGGWEPQDAYPMIHEILFELESQLTQVRSEVSRLERSQESLNSKLYQESKELTQVREELRIARNEVL